MQCNRPKVERPLVRMTFVEVLSSAAPVATHQELPVTVRWRTWSILPSGPASHPRRLWQADGKSATKLVTARCAPAQTAPSDSSSGERSMLGTDLAVRDRRLTIVSPRPSNSRSKRAA